MSDLENFHFFQDQLLCLQVISGQDNDFLDCPPICETRKQHKLIISFVPGNEKSSNLS